MVHCLPSDVLSLEKFVGHQLTIFFLKVSYDICHGLVYGVSRAITDIHEIRFLKCGDDLLHGRFLDSRHFLKHTHFLRVSDSHVRICVVGCSVCDDERTCLSQVNKGSGPDECILRISEH